MAGLIESGMALGAGFLGAKRARNQAEKDKKNRLKLIESMDWEPMYAAETVPTYQHSRSPVARSFLESFLMGTNPAATYSGTPNAQALQAAQQRRENQLFGTPEARLQQQRQMESETPWKVNVPTRKVVPNNDATFTAQAPKLKEMGLNDNLRWAVLGVQGGKEALGNNGVTFATAATGKIPELSRLIEQYGDPDKLADDIRSGRVKLWGHTYGSSEGNAAKDPYRTMKA